MSDDKCGAECADGSPCEHPAGSCPVPSHSNEDAENHGRPSAFTYRRAHRAIETARDGLSKAGCARAAGVGEATLKRWLDGDKWLGATHFRSAFRRARNQGETQLVQEGLYDEDVDSSMAKFLLASSFDYKKTEKKEVENTGDEPLTNVVIDFEDVDT